MWRERRGGCGERRGRIKRARKGCLSMGLGIIIVLV